MYNSPNTSSSLREKFDVYFAKNCKNLSVHVNTYNNKEGMKQKPTKNIAFGINKRINVEIKVKWKFKWMASVHMKSAYETKEIDLNGAPWYDGTGNPYFHLGICNPSQETWTEFTISIQTGTFSTSRCKKWLQMTELDTYRFTITQNVGAVDVVAVVCKHLTQVTIESRV